MNSAGQVAEDVLLTSRFKENVESAVLDEYLLAHSGHRYLVFK